MKPSSPTPAPSFFREDTAINYRKYIYLILSNWYWFVLSLLISLTSVWIYHRYYAQNSYKAATTILIEQNKLGGGTPGAGSEMFDGFGNMSGNNNVWNQIEILRSWTHVRRTIEKLDFEVTYVEMTSLRESDIYHDSPFRVVWDRSHPQLLGVSFELDFIKDSNKATLSISGENAFLYDFSKEKVIKQLGNYSLSEQVELNTLLVKPEFSFKIASVDGAVPASKFGFYFQTPEQLVANYQNALAVTKLNEASSLLLLEVITTHPQKAIDFLDKLIEVYQSGNLDKKNLIATKTIDFISSQLLNISDSLKISENMKESFQRERNLFDVSTQSDQLLTQLVALEDQKRLLETKNKYYHYLQDYMLTNKDLGTVIAPATVGIEDPLMSGLVSKLVEFTMQLSTKEDELADRNHPLLKQFQAQIEITKKTITESSKNIISESNKAVADVKLRIARLESQTQQLPELQRRYINIERKYTLNSTTYNLLLQKLSEAQIAKASNTPDNTVINGARLSEGNPVSPNKGENYRYALILALLIPGLIITASEMMNNKICEAADIEKITNLPVIGNVMHYELQQDTKDVPTEDKRTIMLDHPKSPIGESYRALRTKLMFLLKGVDKPVIAVTSTQPGEGKTFTSINIASSFALLGKKTVLLDLDLRNSIMATEFGLAKEEGVSGFLVDAHSLDEIIFPTKHPSLKVIPSGVFPPNPGELLADSKMVELIELLKERFDVIIIDSSPLLVADIFQYTSLCNAYVYVIRQGVTLIPSLKAALEEMENQSMKNVGLVVNDIERTHKALGYGYGYGYGYWYGYGYGEKKKSAKWWKS